MQQALEKIAQDAEAVAEQIRVLIPQCNDYDLLRLLKKLDAELMDVLHNIQLARRLTDKV
jgi:hypothetical protein